MFVEAKNPYQVLKDAGYKMIGESNSFKLHTKEREWFHVYVSNDEQSFTIHYDISKHPDLKKIYSNHKVFQRDTHYDGHPELLGLLTAEVKRIKEFEN